MHLNTCQDLARLAGPKFQKHPCWIHAGIRQDDPDHPAATQTLQGRGYKTLTLR